MKHPKLDGLINKMKRGKDFTVTREEYIKMTGIDIPQKRSYTEKDSAIARAAKENGYTVVVIPEKLEFHKKAR